MPSPLMVDLTPHALDKPLAWDDFVLDLQEALADAEEAIYLVGGAVRDAYLRRPMTDLDLVTSGSGRAVARRIANRFGGAYFPLDDVRDVGRVLLDREEGRLVIDVARFRGDDLSADLAGRDFTVNAIAVDLQSDLNTVIDPLDGGNDLKTHYLRQCAPDALGSDPVRALRGVRQSVQFRLHIEKETLRAIRAVAPILVQISPERLRDETFKILALPKPIGALRIAQTLGLRDAALPFTERMDEATWTTALDIVERILGIGQIISPHRTDETGAKFSLGMMVMALDHFRPVLQTHVAHNWADERSHLALMGLMGIAAAGGLQGLEKSLKAMRLSTDEIARVLQGIRSAFAFCKMDVPLAPLQVYHYWRDGGDAGVDGILLGLALSLNRMGMRLDQDVWIAQMEQARVLFEAWYESRAQKVDPPRLITGHDVKNALPNVSGRAIGIFLERVREGQIEGRILTADDALAWIRAADSTVQDMPNQTFS